MELSASRWHQHRPIIRSNWARIPVPHRLRTRTHHTPRSRSTSAANTRTHRQRLPTVAETTRSPQGPYRRKTRTSSQPQERRTEHEDIRTGRYSRYQEANPNNTRTRTRKSPNARERTVHNHRASETRHVSSAETTRNTRRRQERKNHQRISGAAHQNTVDTSDTQTNHRH